MQKQTHGWNGPELSDSEQLEAYRPLTTEEWMARSEFEKRNLTLAQVNEIRAIRLEAWKKQSAFKHE